MSTSIGILSPIVHWRYPNDRIRLYLWTFPFSTCQYIPIDYTFIAKCSESGEEKSRPRRPSGIYWRTWRRCWDITRRNRKKIAPKNRRAAVFHPGLGIDFHGRRGRWWPIIGNGPAQSSYNNFKLNHRSHGYQSSKLWIVRQRVIDFGRAAWQFSEWRQLYLIPSGNF